MSGAACIIKKRACNPPASAKLQVPELILADVSSGLIPKKLAEDAGLSDYLMRCADLDEKNSAQYELAEHWFIENLRRVEDGQKPVPPPDTWEKYGPEIDPRDPKAVRLE